MKRLTRDRIIERVKHYLGGVMCTELMDYDFEDAMEMTDLWYMSWFGNKKTVTTTYASGAREIDVNDDCVQVTSVTLSSSPTDFMSMLNPAAFQETRYVPGHYFSPGRGSGIGDVGQLLAYFESSALVLGAERDWEFDSENRKIILYPAGLPASSGGTVVYSYISSDINYAKMSPYEQRYYIRWMEAECKKMLGRKRSKYTNLPGPGDNIDVADGQSLIDEAKEDIQTIMEEVKQTPIPFMVG